MNLHLRTRDRRRREAARRTPLLLRLGDGLISTHRHMPFRWSDEQLHERRH